MNSYNLGEKYVVIDMSRAYLLARMSFEAKKVIYDDWLSDDRRYRAAILYERIGTNFNEYFEFLKNVKNPEFLYELSVAALEIFRDNLDMLWMFAYSGNYRELVFLPRIKNIVY